MTDAPTRPMVPTPASSNVAGVTYDSASQVLTMHFRNGSAYQHAGVPILEYTSLLAAESVGKRYNSNIRGKYESTKIESGAKADEQKALAAHFRDHVKVLETTAISDPDESRRLEAARSLAAICLLMEGWRPDEDAGAVNAALWRNSLGA